MTKDILQKINVIFPEAFYDILAYLIPSTFLMISIISTLPEFSSSLLLNIRSTGSFVYDFFIAILIFGVLYLIGQLITTFSFFIITKPVHLLFKIIYRKSDFFRLDFIDTYIKIKQTNTSVVSLEITKRFARCMLSRNISFASLLIIIWILFVYENELILPFLVILMLTFLDYSIRYRWLLRSMLAATKGNIHKENLK